VSELVLRRRNAHAERNQLRAVSQDLTETSGFGFPESLAEPPIRHGREALRMPVNIGRTCAARPNLHGAGPCRLT
jgi:hypothetical protein